FVKYLLYKKYKDEEIRLIVLDALTYAGNLGTIKDDPCFARSPAPGLPTSRTMVSPRSASTSLR
ncbi:MAG: hypothetical protein IKH04_05495, partial [Kiritimatiellae bacterium]|nr:hypothetical protein [Kiritimatiellia bacterium]